MRGVSMHSGIIIHSEPTNLLIKAVNSSRMCPLRRDMTNWCARHIHRHYTILNRNVFGRKELKNTASYTNKTQHYDSVLYLYLIQPTSKKKRRMQHYTSSTTHMSSCVRVPPHWCLMLHVHPCRSACMSIRFVRRFEYNKNLTFSCAHDSNENEVVCYQCIWGASQSTSSSSAHPHLPQIPTWFAPLLSILPPRGARG